MSALTNPGTGCPFLGSTQRQSFLFGDHLCPVECLTKLILFLAVTTLMLYVPLGNITTFCDPEICENPTLGPRDHQNTVMCCICNVYKIMLHVGGAAIDAVELLVCISKNILYEGKMQFYRLLEMLDSQDLCSLICCQEDPKPVKIESQESRHTCQCAKSKSKVI